MIRIIATVLTLALSVSAFAATPSGSKTPYAIQTDTLDGGGRAAINGVYSQIGSLGGIEGVSSVSSYSAGHGYIAQIQSALMLPSPTINVTNQVLAYSPTTQSLPLVAMLVPTSGTVNEGTVTFQLKLNSTVIASSSALPVSNNMASGSLTVPAGQGPNGYTIFASYTGGPTYFGSTGMGSLTLNKYGAKVVFSPASLNVQFDNNPHPLAVAAFDQSNVPLNLPTSEIPVTYQLGGNTPTSSAPSAVGTYTVSATINDANYSGTNTSTVTITPASAIPTNTAVVKPITSIAPLTVDQLLPITAIVGAQSGTLSINQGLVTFLIKNSNNVIVGVATPSGTVSAGNASVMYTIPKNTPVGTYSVSAAFTDSQNNFATSGDATATFIIQTISSTLSVQNATAQRSPSSQQVTLNATVTPVGGPGTISEGMVTFQVKDATNANVGTAVTANVSQGAASAKYTIPPAQALGTYTISATYSGSATYIVNGPATSQLTITRIIGGLIPNVAITAIDRNPARIGLPVNITATGMAFFGQPLTYTWSVVNSAGAPQSQSRVATPPLDPTGTSTDTFQTTFTVEDTFTVTVTVDDGYNSQPSTVTTILAQRLAPNSGTNAANVFNSGAPSPSVTNPSAGGLGITVESSAGGAVQFDPIPAAGTAARAGETYLFTRKKYVTDAGIPTDPNTTVNPALIAPKTAAKFQSPGISIIELNTKVGQKKARIMIPVGQSEVGSPPAFANPNSQQPVVYSVKGTLAAQKAGEAPRTKAVNTSVKISFAVNIPAGLGLADLAPTNSPIDIGVSNLHTTLTLDSKGKPVKSSLSDPTHFQNMLLKLPKLDKTKKTVAGAQMTFSFTLIGNDAATNGFDTDGVTSGTNGVRNLQFAAVIGGIPYQGFLVVTVTTDSFGNISARSQ